MKKKYYWVIGVLLLLIITNPSRKDFNDHMSLGVYENVRRENNFFICSTYKHRNYLYLGIIGNFFKISSPKDLAPMTKAISDTTEKIADTSKMDISKYEVKDLPYPPKKIDTTR